MGIWWPWWTSLIPEVLIMQRPEIKNDFRPLFFFENRCLYRSYILLLILLLLIVKIKAAIQYFQFVALKIQFWYIL